MYDDMTRDSGSDIRRISGGATVARNTAVLLGGQVLAQAISVVLGIFITRVLGAAEYGKYVSAFAFAVLFMSFASMGLDKMLVREMSRRPGEASQLVRDAAVVRLVLSLGVYLAMIAGTYVLRYTPGQRQTALLAGLVTEMASLADFLRGVCRAFERMELDVLSRVLERVAAAVFAAAVLLRWRTATAVVMALALANAVALVSAMLFAQRFVHVRGRPSARAALSLFQMAVPFGIGSIAVNLVTRLDAFFLSLLRPAVEVGSYGAATNIVLPFAMLPQAFSSSLFPRLSREAERDTDFVRRACALSVKWTVAAALPIAAALIGLADVAVLTVLGTTYGSSIVPLRILASGLVLIFANTVVSNVLSALGQQSIVTVVVVVYVVLTVVLCAVLIPRLGISGAALAVVLRDLFGFVTMLFALSRSKLFSPWRSLAGTLASGALMFVALFLLRAANPIWRVAGPIATYVLALLVTGSLGAADWRIAQDLLRTWGTGRRRAVLR